MGAGLGPDRRAAGAGGGDLGHGLGGGDMEDHHRRARGLGEAAHAGDGLDLGFAGAGGGVVDGTCAPSARRRARASAMMASFSAWMQVSAPASRAMVSARRISPSSRPIL
jgi:hypothetical protein